MAENERHYCMVAMPKEAEGNTRAALLNEFKWPPGTTVRVRFLEGDPELQIPAPEPTMNYGWLTPDSNDDELHRVVAHEFGHALGLIHEHQNPDTPIDWNRAAVIADLSGPPNNWDEATIENNMFKRYDPSEVSTTPTDRLSIMMYPIPASWTNDGFSADLNKELSDTDRDFIRGAYPW